MTPDTLDELLAASEQLTAIEQVLDLLRDKIRRLEAAGQDAAAYRQVAGWLYHKSQERLEQALAAREAV